MAAGDEGRAAGRERAVAVVGDEEALVVAERLAGDQVDARVVGRRDRRRPSGRASARCPGRCPTRRSVGSGPETCELPIRSQVTFEALRVHRVVADVEARADAAVGPQVRVAVVVPERRVDAVRVGRVDRDVDGAGPRRRGEVGREDADPVRAAVGRPVEAALAAGRVDVAGGRDEDAVRVRRVDRDPADHRGVREPDVRPGGAAVGRLVDAVAAVGDAAAGGVRLAGAGPERAVRAARERADRLRVVVRPGRRVGHAGVGALPDAAARGGDVDRVGAGSGRPRRRSRGRRCCWRRRTPRSRRPRGSPRPGRPRAGGWQSRGSCGRRARGRRGCRASCRPARTRRPAGRTAATPGARWPEARAEHGDERDQRQGRERHHHPPPHRRSAPARRFPRPSHVRIPLCVVRVARP